MKKRLLPDVLNDQEREQLLKSFNLRYPTSFRNYCMIRLMMDSGLRVSEVLSLKTSHIDFMSGKLRVVQGKGKKDRNVWINDALLEYLRKWRKISNEIRIKYNIAVNNNYLFVTLKGTRIFDSYMRSMIKRISKRSGISKNVYCHLLRHGFGTDLYKKTKNIRLVQKSLGHSNLSTTMIYTHIYDNDVEREMKSLRE